MARPRREISAELAAAPDLDADALEGVLLADQRWVRITEILLLALARTKGRAGIKETAERPAPHYQNTNESNTHEGT